AHLFPAIDDAAEQVSGLLGVVTSRVRLAAIEVDTRRRAGFGEHGLAVGEPGQCRGIKTGERVKRIALHVQPRYSGVEEAQVKAGVVSDQYRALAAIGLECLADPTENVG